MKRTLALALCGALTAGCSAQSARVDVAYKLYQGCVAATFPIQYPFPTTTKSTKDFVESLDKYCMDWTAIWLPTLTEDHTSITAAEDASFNKLRMKVINEVIETITLYNIKPAK